MDWLPRKCFVPGCWPLDFLMRCCSLKSSHQWPLMSWEFIILQWPWLQSSEGELWCSRDADATGKGAGSRKGKLLNSRKEMLLLVWLSPLSAYAKRSITPPNDAHKQPVLISKYKNKINRQNSQLSGCFFPPFLSNFGSQLRPNF